MTEMPTEAEFESFSRGLDERTRLLYDFLCFSGLRIGEVCGNSHTYYAYGEKKYILRPGLLWGHVIEFNGAMPAFKASFSVDGKRAKIRQIPLSNRLKSILNTLMNKKVIGQAQLSERLFEVDRRTVAKEFKRVSKLFGKSITPHYCRHRFLTALVKKGQIKQAQLLAGHQSISTTLEIYSHLNIDDLAEVMPG